MLATRQKLANFSRSAMTLPITPALTTDCVVFKGKGELLLVKRRNVAAHRVSRL